MATTSTVDDRSGAVSVLVVDGDPVEARFVAESLELSTPDVSTRRANDSDAAIDAVADGGIDCVVVGSDLGETDGLALVDRVARTDASVRAVVLADADDPALAREVWARGAAYARTDADGDHYDLLARHVTGRMDEA